MDNKKAIVSDGFKIRWLACSCFEIQLPGGKTLVTDPYITDSGSHLQVDDVGGADYILVTHTHYDHVLDVGYLAAKYNSKVLVGMQSAYDLAAYFDMNMKHLHAVTNGDVFEFEDCRVEAFFGKHPDLPYTASQLGRDVAEKYGYKGMERVNNNGSLEFVSYLVTLQNNLRILVWGGKITDEQYNRLNGIQPNIALLQIPGHKIPALSKFIGHLAPQIVIPHHHDSLKKPGLMGPVDVDQYLGELAAAMKSEAPHSILMNPQMGQWYQVSLAASMV